jgi:hypothetical protein
LLQGNISRETKAIDAKALFALEAPVLGWSNEDKPAHGPDRHKTGQRQ